MADGMADQGELGETKDMGYKRRERIKGCFVEFERRFDEEPRSPFHLIGELPRPSANQRNQQPLICCCADLCPQWPTKRTQEDLQRCLSGRHIHKPDDAHRQEWCSHLAIGHMAVPCGCMCIQSDQNIDLAWSKVLKELHCLRLNVKMLFGTV